MIRILQIEIADPKHSNNPRLVEKLQWDLNEAILLKNVAESVFELTAQINKLKEQRRLLTPDSPTAYMALLDTMRTGEFSLINVFMSFCNTKE